MNEENEMEDEMENDPVDQYEEYSEWLCGQSHLMICNGDDLIRHFEAGTGFDEFMRGEK